MNMTLDGLPPEYMLAALYNFSRPQGMSWLATVNGPDVMSADEARKLLERLVSGRAVATAFDYVYGRPIKVTFQRDGDDYVVLRTDLFDRDAGPGAALRAYKAAMDAFTSPGKATVAR